MPNAVEEILRWVSPIIYLRRTATRDCSLGGKQIRAGDKLVQWLASGNRDEDLNPDPDVFDIARAKREAHRPIGAEWLADRAGSAT